MLASTLWLQTTFLSGFKLGDQLGDMLASTLWLQTTFLLGSILDHCLGLVIALFIPRDEGTASRGADLPWFLGTAGDGSVLLDRLLGNRTHFLGPLGALGVGGVARSLILTLLLNLCGTLNNIILHLMNLLLCPALRLILGSADLRPLLVTVFDQRCSADCNSLIEGNLLVCNETVLPEVLLALLLLLRLVVGGVGGVAPLVIGVVTLNHIVILSLLHHLHLVNTLLAIRSRTSSSNISKAHTLITTSLSSIPAIKSLAGTGCMVIMVLMVLPMVRCLCIEGEGTNKGSRISCSSCSSVPS